MVTERQFSYSKKTLANTAIHLSTRVLKYSKNKEENKKNKIAFLFK